MMILILVLFTLGLVLIGIPFAVAIAAIIDSASRKRLTRRPAHPAKGLAKDARVCAC